MEGERAKTELGSSTEEINIDALKCLRCGGEDEGPLLTA